MPRIAASKLFTSRIQNVNKQSILRAVSNISWSHVDVQLPKLNLPCFGGGVREWTSFQEQFQSAIDISHLTDINNIYVPEK